MPHDRNGGPAQAGIEPTNSVSFSDRHGDHEFVKVISEQVLTGQRHVLPKIL